MDREKLNKYIAKSRQADKIASRRFGIKPPRSIKEAEDILSARQLESSAIQDELSNQILIEAKGEKWRKQAGRARLRLDAEIKYLKDWLKRVRQETELALNCDIGKINRHKPYDMLEKSFYIIRDMLREGFILPPNQKAQYDVIRAEVYRMKSTQIALNLGKSNPTK